MTNSACWPMVSFIFVIVHVRMLAFIVVKPKICSPDNWSRVLQLVNFKLQVNIAFFIFIIVVF